MFLASIIDLRHNDPVKNVRSSGFNLFHTKNTLTKPHILPYLRSGGAVSSAILSPRTFRQDFRHRISSSMWKNNTVRSSDEPQLHKIMAN